MKNGIVKNTLPILVIYIQYNYRIIQCHVCIYIEYLKFHFHSYKYTFFIISSVFYLLDKKYLS